MESFKAVEEGRRDFTEEKESACEFIHRNEETIFRDGKGNVNFIDDVARTTSYDLELSKGDSRITGFAGGLRHSMSLPGWLVGGSYMEDPNNHFEIGHWEEEDADTGETYGGIIGGGLHLPDNQRLRNLEYKKHGFIKEEIIAIEESIKRAKEEEIKEEVLEKNNGSNLEKKDKLDWQEIAVVWRKLGTAFRGRDVGTPHSFGFLPDFEQEHPWYQAGGIIQAKNRYRSGSYNKGYEASQYEKCKRLLKEAAQYRELPPAKNSIAAGGLWVGSKGLPKGDNNPIEGLPSWIYEK